MKGKLFLLFVLISLYPLGIDARGINDIVERLESLDCYRGEATFSVLLPQAMDDVAYTLRLESMPTAAGDTLSPCNYLIDWSLAAPTGTTDGFSAYFDGHHYRYRAGRLQEYHSEWDATPFMPRGKVADGVQRQVQFAGVLPQFVGLALREMEADDRWSIEVRDVKRGGVDCVVVSCVMRLDGEKVQQAVYTFDGATLLPLTVESENNIGAVSEQTVTVKYRTLEGECAALTEAALIERYPEPFERFRESNFRIENMAGTELPQFSLPAADGGRYTHHRGERLAAPTVIALLDPETGYNAEMIADLRKAAEALGNVETVMAFNTTNVDRVAELAGEPAAGEHLLLKAGSLARDIGAASLPVVLLVGADAKVYDVIIGFNKDLANIVIQKMAVATR